MSANTTIQALPYSLGTDNPKTIDDTMKSLAQAIEKKLCMSFLSASDRDTKVGTPVDGMVCYLQDTDVLQLRRAGAWVQIYPLTFPTITSGTTVPANSSGADGDIFFAV